LSWVKGQCLWIRHGRESAGLTLAVGRRIGKAVVRNRLKRRLRQIYAGLDPRPASLVIYPQHGAGSAPFRALADELASLLSRL
tara:strand:- start:332 stop:580 length:249 start_codon:yes stop_codon:yes gene_type:complete